MAVKKLLVFVWFGLMVYTLKPIYLCQSIETKNDHEFFSIDSFSNGSFIIDLDKMILTNPATIMSTPEIITIKKVTHLDNNVLVLKVKKDSKYSIELYYLKFDGSGNPVSVRTAYKNVYKTYTAAVKNLDLRSVCTKIKMATVPYTTGAAAPDALMKLAWPNAVFTDASNYFELKDGAITWTEGKDKNAVPHHLTISESTVSTSPEAFYMQFTCKDAAGIQYSVMFYRINSQYPYYNHINVEKAESNSWTTMYFY